ncbi:MAG: D-alanyl-D-alanine carboxypeptidase [Clostridia bacterium]|nr:D-alanyl-D-alanine carboxypeptidase [Clostridia bacterium]
MNDRSKDMMLTNTLFSNCTGLPKETQYSSAKDVAFMLKSLLNHTLYFKYSNIWLDKIVHPDGSATTLTNTNKLIRFYDGCDGGKTGFTNESKYCLAATAKRGDTRLITVVIGENDSKTRFSDVKNFFERGFSNYLTKIVLDKNVSLEEKLYSPFVKGEWIDVYPEENLCAFCQKGETSDFKYKVNLTNPMSKTIKNGDVVGEIILFKNGVECSRTEAIVRDEIDLINYGDALDRVFENWSVAK